MLNISQDERERAIFRSRRMYQTDLASNLATAEDRGRRAGRIEGLRDGKIDVAKKMLKRNRPIDEISEDTGLSLAEIESLRGKQ